MRNGNALKTSVNGFAQRIRDLRKQKNLSQTTLAEQVGIHYTHLGRYERGTSQPTADVLARMAAALGVSTDYLMEGTTSDAVRARFEDQELMLQFQEVEKLPTQDKEVIKNFLDAFLMRRKIQSLSHR